VVELCLSFTVGVNIMSKGMSDDWRTMRGGKTGGDCAGPMMEEKGFT